MKGSGLDLPAYVIWLILALLACGVEIGESFQPSRIAVLCAFLLILLGGIRIKHATKVTHFLLTLAVVWLTWGAVSLLWTPDIDAGTRETGGIALGLATAFTFTHLTLFTSSTSHALKAIRTGWTAALILTFPIAAWEFLFDAHLSSSLGQMETGGLGSFSINYASTTFGNPNTYVAFIGLAFPFTLWSFSSARTYGVRLLCLAASIGGTGIVLMNASRLGTAMIMLQLIAWLWLMGFLKGMRKGLVKTMIVGLFAFLGVLIWQVSGYTQMKFINLFWGTDASATVRWDLFRNGALFFMRSWGIGVGAGGFQQSMMGAQGISDTGSGKVFIIDPHNLWIEIFAQYGILVGILFTAWLLYCLRVMIAAVRQDKLLGLGEVGNAARCGIVLMVGFPLNFLLNSHYVTFTILWAALASMASISLVALKVLPAVETKRRRKQTQQRTPLAKTRLWETTPNL